MVTLEQVKLLDTRVTKTVEYIKKITDENTLLKGKLDDYQKRINDLEILIRQFKEDQNRIEDGILSALDRLNQFEDALEKNLNPLPLEEKSDDEIPLLDPSDPLDPPDHDEPENELDIF